MTVEILILLMVNYLVGAIPFSFIVGKFYGVDIRRVGSGNVGATNVLRACGKRAGAMAYFLDIFKGVFTAFLTTFYFYKTNFLVNNVDHKLWIYIIYIIPIIGHIFTVFLKFKGGKGVATSAGIFLMLTPVSFFLTFIVFFIVLRSMRVVSLASICAISVFPIFILLQNIFVDFYFLSYRNLLHKIYPDSFLVFVYIISVVIIVLHRSNISRILKGEEYVFGNRSKKDES